MRVIAALTGPYRRIPSVITVFGALNHDQPMAYIVKLLCGGGGAFFLAWKDYGED